MHLRGAGVGKQGEELFHLPTCVKELNGLDTDNTLQSQRALTQSGTTRYKRF